MRQSQYAPPSTLHAARPQSPCPPPLHPLYASRPPPCSQNPPKSPESGRPRARPRARGREIRGSGGHVARLPRPGAQHTARAPSRRPRTSERSRASFIHVASRSRANTPTGPLPRACHACDGESFQACRARGARLERARTERQDRRAFIATASPDSGPGAQTSRGGVSPGPSPGVALQGDGPQRETPPLRPPPLLSTEQPGRKRAWSRGRRTELGSQISFLWRREG